MRISRHFLRPAKNPTRRPTWEEEEKGGDVVAIC